MNLTTQEMDEINLLLTEVSLELLGNKFYDINGQIKYSLTQLYEKNGSASLSPNFVPHHSDLAKALDIELAMDPAQRQNRQFPMDQPKPIATRRQSTDNSLLTPMKIARTSPATIRQRRKTIFDISSSKLNKFKQPPNFLEYSSFKQKYSQVNDGNVANQVQCTTNKDAFDNVMIMDELKINKNDQKFSKIKTKSTGTPTLSQSMSIFNAKDSTNTASDTKTTEDNPNSKRINYQVQLIKEKVAFEFERMARISQKNRETDFTFNQRRMEAKDLNCREVIERFHKKEHSMLTQESGILIEFVKFIRTDPKNEYKMQEIVANILAVKDQI